MWYLFVSRNIETRRPGAGGAGVRRRARGRLRRQPAPARTRHLPAARWCARGAPPAGAPPAPPPPPRCALAADAAPPLPPCRAPTLVEVLGHKGCWCHTVALDHCPPRSLTGCVCAPQPCCWVPSAPPPGSSVPPRTSRCSGSSRAYISGQKQAFPILSVKNSPGRLNVLFSTVGFAKGNFWGPSAVSGGVLLR
jgi:hypothetical protein